MFRNERGDMTVGGHRTEMRKFRRKDIKINLPDVLSGENWAWYKFHSGAVDQ